MSKRLKAPRYRKLIAFLESIMEDPKRPERLRTQAALRLDGLYARLDMLDERAINAKESAIAHARKLELRSLQIAHPTLPLPNDSPEDKHMKSVFDAVLKPGGADES